MGAEIKLLKTEERKTRAEASAFMRQLADKIDSGNVVLRTGQTEISLAIPASVILELQVEDEDKGTKGTQHSLEVTVKWFDGDEGGGPLELG
jgi:amphi-Trp domain-containing protein